LLLLKKPSDALSSLWYTGNGQACRHTVKTCLERATVQTEGVPFSSANYSPSASHKNTNTTNCRAAEDQYNNRAARITHLHFLIENFPPSR